MFTSGCDIPGGGLDGTTPAQLPILPAFDSEVKGLPALPFAASVSLKSMMIA
jgi:hypothetical protein